MSKINDLERQVQSLSADELASFRQWFAELDAEACDRQFEADVKSGKLDALAERARQAHAAGNRPSFDPLRFAGVLGLLSGLTG